MDISWSNAKECLVGFQILWSCRRRSQERMRTGGHLLPFHIGAAGCFICHCVPWTSEGGQVLSGPKRRPLKSPKVCMGSLTFSCSCRAYPYVQFYTECTHVFWFISYCGGWTEVLWWQLGSTPWVRCRHHHHLLLPVEQAGCILLTSQGLIPFTVNPGASIHSCASQSAWLCHRFIVNARLDQKWGPGAPAICKVLCFVSSAMHVTVTVPDILTPCTKTLQVSQRLYISARLCISIYFIHIYPY